MPRFLRSCLVVLTLAVFSLGCSNSDSTPRAINVKEDTRLRRVGEGNPNQGKSEGAKQALP